jgi:hypothetical protein
MKSTGANTRDIAIPYVVYVLLISIGAIIISIPIANWVGSVYSDFAAGILNFKISSYEIPFWVYIVQVSAGILIPLISSIYPIYRNCKITVKEGLAEQTDSNKNIKSNLSLIRRVINKSNTKIAIPLNNVFRKKGRAILAILALATGGVLFMASQNIVASINNTANVSMNTFRYDYDIKLYGQYPDDKILETLSGIKVIDKAEIYKSRKSFLKSRTEPILLVILSKLYPEIVRWLILK